MHEHVCSELSCCDCGMSYTVWYTDDALWNSVMRDADGCDVVPFVCARCFMIRSRELYPIMNVGFYRGLLAPQIEASSWLQEERFAAFRSAYAYASAKSVSVLGLSKLKPEDAYFVWLMLQRGMDRQDGQGASTRM